MCEDEQARRLCDVSVTRAWDRIDDSVTAGGLQRGARGMQPSIADENTRQRIMPDGRGR